MAEQSNRGLGEERARLALQEATRDTVRGASVYVHSTGVPTSDSEDVQVLSVSCGSGVRIRGVIVTLADSAKDEPPRFDSASEEVNVYDREQLVFLRDTLVRLVEAGALHE